MEETIRSKCDGNFMGERLGCHHLIHPHKTVIDCASKGGPDDISQPLLQCGLVGESLSDPFDLGWPCDWF